MGRMPLAIRKLADTSEGARVKQFDPITGEGRLINPETGVAEPWPFAGIEIEGGAPQQTRVPTSFVATGRAKGWITVEGERIVHRPGGPPDDPWRVTHTFIHLDSLTIRTVTGNVHYRVTHQPDKYVDSEDDDAPVTPEDYESGNTRVDAFYDLELEG